ncbi:MAG TPA: serine hydrolase domain-containing protein [Gemmatimonadaceae bacterium]|nr:serine hydrolase domain-containing protein [Gemmatimonadaceae bacterium]
MRPRHSLIASAAMTAALTLPCFAQAARGTRVSREVIARAADSLADAAVRSGNVAALSIAVVRGSDTVVMKGYGLANVENDVAATAQTVYRIGSVTKQFTSVTIMRLVEQGKLSLDDDVTKYVPTAPTQGRRILVRHLLNHTSGIPSYTDVGPEFGRKSRLDLPQDSLLAIVRNDSLQFDPGTHFYYNNTGYFLLGMIIEKVTGKPYGEYLRDSLFVPNGLASTIYCSNGPIIKRRASGYDRGRNGLVNTDYLSMDLPYAAGSLCSTIGDLTKWTALLHSGKLVKASSFAAMTTPVKLTSGRAMSYGFGLSADTLGSHRRIHHGGGINGFISELAYYPNDSLTIVVLANTSPAPSSELADALGRVALGLPARGAPERPADLPIAADESARLVGSYVVIFPDGSRRPTKLSTSGEQQLMMQIEGQPAVRLLKQSAPNTFVAMGQPGRIIVDVVNGKVTGFVIDRGARPLEAIRVN